MEPATETDSNIGDTVLLTKFDEAVEKHFDGVTRSYESDYSIRFVGIRSKDNRMPMPESAHDVETVGESGSLVLMTGYMRGVFENVDDAEAWGGLQLRAAGFLKADTVAEEVD